jgi:hypothetical protein
VENIYFLRLYFSDLHTVHKDGVKCAGRERSR